MMAAGIRRSIVRSGRSRTAFAFGLVHVLVFVFTVFSHQPLPPPSEQPCPPDILCVDPWSFFGIYLAGRYFHGPTLNLIMLADFPALAVASLVQNAFYYAGMSQMTRSYIDAGVWLSFGTIQWWLLGAFLDAMKEKRRHNTPLQPTAEKRGG